MAFSGEVDLGRLRAAYEKTREELLAERTPVGHWVGELSSSALATATAVSALAMARSRESGVRSQADIDDLISRGVAWLVGQQNEDGGFGDTYLSYSNIATTMLVVAALHLTGVADGHAKLIQKANAYIDSKGRLKGLRERYGIDKTFVVPIMTNLALAGLVEWREVDALPFELACVPQAWYRFVGMPVVSYAIPALVAIGQARHFHAPSRNPVIRLIRWLSITRSLKVLRWMQPESGGYLEATPLTSFVVMSLASVSSSKSQVPSSVAAEVIREGVKFLVQSARPDGSWPIDTDLATWNTTLAINALAGAGEEVATLLAPQCLDWLLSCQHTRRHAFTGADPGGFGWSDLSGAVPDADDTPGALLVLDCFTGKYWDGVDNSTVSDSVQCAAGWLLRLQNRDGGWPTFCRGWGKLPFDRSGSDLTAHVLRALPTRLAFPGEVVSVRPSSEQTGDSSLPDVLVLDVEHAQVRGRRFLARAQNPDGSWSPLWFGNQDHPSEENLVYGTAKVLMAYRDLDLMDSPEARRGVAWLVANQNADGGWGSGVWDRGRRTKDEGRSSERSASASENPESKIHCLKSSVEETALAVEALLAAADDQNVAAAVRKGLTWLVERVESGQHRQPAPIGFYFAKLWYYERLYPLTFTVAALGRACRQFARPNQTPDIPAETASSDAP